MHNTPHTQETKLKISLNHKGKHYSEKSEFKKGNKVNWNGGKYITENGYVYIYSPDHPNKYRTGYYPEHRLVMEKEIGRILTKDEVIHHIDHNKQNNDVTNLMLLNKESHRKLHSLEEKKLGIKYYSRLNRFVTFNGHKKIVMEWANELNISFAALRMRLDRGWTVERALLTGMRKYAK